MASSVKPRCKRCDIEDPVVISVLHEPLCPNCLHLKNHHPDRYRREPNYGPIPQQAGWPNPVPLF